MTEPAPWWRSAVVYQIYPRSFRDTSGNGVGDLRGIIDGLGHLETLGVDAIWLSPVFPSPMVDHGYDVSDYCDIDPLFGTLADFDELVEAVHQRSLRIILDWVPNHTSDAHPWFIESRSSRDNPKRNWYHWRNDNPGELPNNWTRAFPAGEPAWAWDPGSEAWYLNQFSPEQPDLNWSNPEVRSAMADSLRFWLDRGVDGFRMDVIHLIGKDPALPDVPAELAALPAVVLVDEPAAHEYLREIRAVLDGYHGDRVAIGEVYLLDSAQIATYYGSNGPPGSDTAPELHLAFNFPAMFGPWDAEAWRTNLAGADQHFASKGLQTTWVLSNHDNPRHRTRFGGDEAVARAAAVLLLGLPGTPFLYAGEELGLEDADVPSEAIVDPSGGRRDGCRAPIPWTAEAGHGWASARTWLPFPPGSNVHSVAAQGDDPRSMLALYRHLLAVRSASDALRLGHHEVVQADDQVLAWVRPVADGGQQDRAQQHGAQQHGAQQHGSTQVGDVLVAVNFTAGPAGLDDRAGWTVLASSNPSRAIGGTISDQLMENEALWAAPPR
ncbi:alpha-amylase family glycosyl hydrolase [Candidatus Microthrix parvicella]|uniref:alpha-amylase family glycosyl hydrolase n=1 Tax=Candidatus Neomicrothrix parvicella TaxID=41950 RepID=UPI00035E5A51|nr:alpha-amylase family glycosyl hydrolase [Candidatus Microthrix parvicella]